MLDLFRLGCMAKKECSLDYLMLVFSTLFGLTIVVLPIFWFQTHFLPFPPFLLDCGTRDEPWTPALWNMDLTAGSVVLFYSETKFHKTEANQTIFSSKYGFHFLSVQQMGNFYRNVIKEI